MSDEELGKMDRPHELGKKGADIAKVATEVINNPKLVKDMIEGLAGSIVQLEGNRTQ